MHKQESFEKNETLKRLCDFERKYQKKKNGSTTVVHDREVRIKLWNMKVMVIPIVVCALGIISKALVKGLVEKEIGG